MSSATDAQKMILWCRNNGIAWRTLTVGNLTIDGSDLKLAEEVKPAQAVARTSIRSRYGADVLMASSAEEEQGSSVVEMLDD